MFLTDQRNLKLGDFGTATNLAKTIKSVEKMTGTPLYFAPEIVKGAHHSFKADVWSLGVVFYHLLALEYPFYDTSFGGLLGKICDAEPPILPSVYSQELRDFVMSFLVKNETDRPEMEDVCRSEWFLKAIEKFPEEQDKFTQFRPQMNIRITENFLQREFDAIRVFRCSEDQSNILKNSLGYFPSNGKSFFDIFQSNVGGDADSRRTSRLLSRFARQPDGSQNWNDLSQDESQLVEEDELEFKFGMRELKANDNSKKSTNVTDQGVQISFRGNTGVDWKCEPVMQIIQQAGNLTTTGKCFSAVNPSLIDLKQSNVKSAQFPFTQTGSEKFHEYGSKTGRCMGQGSPALAGSPKTFLDRANAGTIGRSEKIRPWNPTSYLPKQKSEVSRLAIKNKPKLPKQKSAEQKQFENKLETLVPETPILNKAQPKKGLKNSPSSPHIYTLSPNPLVQKQSKFKHESNLSKYRKSSKLGLKSSSSAKLEFNPTSQLATDRSQTKNTNEDKKSTKLDKKLIEAIVDLGSIALHKRIGELKAQNASAFEYSMADEWELQLTHCMVEKMRAALINVLVEQ